MLTVTATECTDGFVVPVYFERTERFRERIVDCSREELTDLAFCYLNKLEQLQGLHQKTSLCLEEYLGYLEPLTGTRKG